MVQVCLLSRHFLFCCFVGHRIRADRAYMDAVMKAGAEKASERAAVTLKKAYEAVGFVTRP